MDDAYLISQTATVPLPDPGDWTIALVDAADSDLATYPFEPDELTDGEENPTRPAIIAEIVPWSTGTAKVEIRYQGQVKDSRSVSANAPTVTMDTPTAGHLLADGPFTASWSGSDLDGDALTYSLLYSNDGGTNWQTLATGLTEQQLELNTDNLPGGSGMLRVLASDGVAERSGHQRRPSACRCTPRLSISYCRKMGRCSTRPRMSPCREQPTTWKTACRRTRLTSGIPALTESWAVEHR